MEESKQPPIGLIPKKYHQEMVDVQRFADISLAINRYAVAKMEVPIEWLEEYEELKNTPHISNLIKQTK